MSALILNLDRRTETMGIMFRQSYKCYPVPNRILFVVPNLERRPDRWEWCRDSLLSQGVPEAHIIRFPAFDGLRYVDEHGDHRNLSIIQNMLSQYFGCLPRCLRYRYNMMLTQYAWCSTWYAMLDKIAKMPTNEHICWLIDDFTISVPYETLLRYVNILSEVATRAWRTLFAIQLCHYTHEETYTGVPVAECSQFQYGFSTPDDGAMICTPRGATWLMNYLNNIVLKGIGPDPVICLATIKACRAKNGFFGIYPPKTPVKRGRAGLAVIDGITGSLEQPEFTDRELSKYLHKEDSNA